MSKQYEPPSPETVAALKALDGQVATLTTHQLIEDVDGAPLGVAVEQDAPALVVVPWGKGEAVHFRVLAEQLGLGRGQPRRHLRRLPRVPHSALTLRRPRRRRPRRGSAGCGSAWLRRCRAWTSPTSSTW